VVLNSNNPGALAVLDSTENLDGDFARGQLQRDFYRQISYLATLSETFDSLEEYPSESLGGLYKRVLGALGHDRQTLHNDLMQSPAAFESLVQDTRWG